VPLFYLAAAKKAVRRRRILGVCAADFWISERKKIKKNRKRNMGGRKVATFLFKKREKKY